MSDNTKHVVNIDIIDQSESSMMIVASVISPKSEGCVVLCDITVLLSQIPQISRGSFD